MSKENLQALFKVVKKTPEKHNNLFFDEDEVEEIQESEPNIQEKPFTEKLESDKEVFKALIKSEKIAIDNVFLNTSKDTFIGRYGLGDNEFLKNATIEEIKTFIGTVNPVSTKPKKNKKKSKQEVVDNRKFTDAYSVYGKIFPKKDYLVYENTGKEMCGVIPAKGAILLGAAIREGKTTLALELALSVATGGKFLNHFNVNPGKVLFCLKQGDEEFLHNKVKGFYPKTPPAELKNFMIDTHKINGNTVTLPIIQSLDENFDKLEGFIKENPNTRLIVFDMIDDYLNIDNLSGSEKMRVVNDLNNFARKNNILILALRHTAKIQKDYVKKSLAIQGHMKELGGYSGLILLRKNRQEYEIQFELREGSIREINAEFLITDNRIQLNYTGEAMDLEGVKRKVYDTIANNPKINARRITEIIYGSEYTEGQYQNVRGETLKLEKLGLIERKGSRKTGGYQVK